MKIEWKDIKDCPENVECIFDVEFKEGEGYTTDRYVGYMHDGYFYLNIIWPGEITRLYKHDSCSIDPSNIRVFRYCEIDEINSEYNPDWIATGAYNNHELIIIACDCLDKLVKECHIQENAPRNLVAKLSLLLGEYLDKESKCLPSY